MEDADIESLWQQLTKQLENDRLHPPVFTPRLIAEEIKLHITVPLPKTDEVKITADPGYKVLLGSLVTLFALLLTVTSIATHDMHGIYIAAFLLLLLAGGFMYLSATWLVIGRKGIRCGDGTFVPWSDLYNCAIVSRVGTKHNSTNLYLFSKTEGQITYHVDELSATQISHYIAFYRPKVEEVKTGDAQ